MSVEYLEKAFASICQSAKPAKGAYVSLYVDEQYYGGPEEGGWWGTDSRIIAYQWFPTEEEAEAARDAVMELAKQMTTEARNNWGQHCLDTCEWLEARGLEADYLGEVDGPDTYSVVLEERPGEFESTGPRHYE